VEADHVITVRHRGFIGLARQLYKYELQLQGVHIPPRIFNNHNEQQQHPNLSHPLVRQYSSIVGSQTARSQCTC
jgi:dephospho-CoA kinase